MRINTKIMLLFVVGLLLTSVVIGVLAVGQLNRSGKMAIAKIEELLPEYLERIDADGNSQLEAFREELLLRKKEYLKSQVQTTIGVLEKAYQDAHNPEKLMALYKDQLHNAVNTAYSAIVAIEQDESLSLEEKKQKAAAMIKALRYGPDNKDYFWINDLHPNMVMHPYKPKLDGQDLSDFKDPNGFWTGQMVHVMVFVYNTKLVPAPEAPKSWNDFLDPKWQDRVAFCNPNNSGSAFTQFTLMLDLWGAGDEAWKKAQTVLKHAKITQQSSLVYKGVAQGEFPAGITMEYAGYRYKVGGAPVEVVYPSDGTVAYTEGAAIIKDCQNLENAKKFMDWASSLEARKKIVKEFMRRPARSDIDFNALVPGMIPLAKVNQLKGYDKARWTAERKEVLNKVKDILLRVK